MIFKLSGNELLKLISVKNNTIENIHSPIQNIKPFQTVITETVSTMKSQMAGNCVYVCVCKGLERRGPCGDRKSTGAQKQTNKTQAAVIKSSLVLVMHRNAAERQTAPAFLTNGGQSPELV